MSTSHLAPHLYREKRTLSAIVAAPAVAALAGAFEGYVHPSVGTSLSAGSSSLGLPRSGVFHLISPTRDRDFILDWGSLVLGGVAQLGQSVPYLSGAIQLGVAILNIVKAMRASQEQCLELIKRICIVFLAIQDSLNTSDGLVPQNLRTNIDHLKSTLRDIYEFVREQCGKPWIKRMLRSSTDTTRIANFHRNLEDSLRVFDLKSHIDIHFVLSLLSKQIQVGFRDIRSLFVPCDHPTTSPDLPKRALSADTTREEQYNLSYACDPPFGTSLPPAPAHFYGREEELERLVRAATATTGNACTSLAILGTGGIGKTSVALRAIHDPRVVRLYGSRRFFIPCASVTTYEGLITTIAASIGLPRVINLSSATLMDFLTEGGGPTVLVLDNFETPWEQMDARVKVEELLCHLCGLPTLTLVLTMRGAERPLGPSWTSFHSPLRTLGLNAARQTFVAISGIDEKDPHIDALVLAVDRLPLAIALMANMAQVESTEKLLRRWETEKTSMLTRGGVDRLASLDISIAISLSCPRMIGVARGEALLSLLSLLPCGEMDDALLAAFSCSQELPKAIQVLLSTALAFRNANTSRLRVLAPIREYILQYYPPEREPDLLRNLAAYYLEKATKDEVDFYSARNWVNLVDYMVPRKLILESQRQRAWAYRMSCVQVEPVFPQTK
ncbi:hypothetical protein BOTBODRAFT_184202 [Botryobasidium botryosum FD-172 SS1]|uniref:Uncharacterized protein n=1 Tax=Botryobasidium botryosum (strain FD-172 SS1) TaxID=930990 RepID=A0A067N8Z7_BOTB1|nr:hypothetical protein BOTBODRAFT_184202 [Botryobasidium botryosum FD-172 SS1]